MNLKNRLYKIAEPICQDKKLRLVGIQVQGSQRNPVFNVFADSEQGITLGQCTELTRLIQDELDMGEQFLPNYRLNVSSPGLDKALTEDWEFQKNIGNQLKVVYSEDEAKKEITGKLLGWTCDSIEIENEGDGFSIPRDRILRAKIKLQW